MQQGRGGMLAQQGRANSQTSPSSMRTNELRASFNAESSANPDEFEQLYNKANNNLKECNSLLSKLDALLKQ